MFLNFNPKQFSLLAFLFLSVFMFNACGDDDEAVPEEEDEVEVITQAVLTFTDASGNTVSATAEDPDGEGVADLAVLGDIDLTANTSYTLSVALWNGLEEPAESISEEVAEEDDEHQFFFAFTTDAFSNPAGNGNIDTSSDPINYGDVDANGNPLGLTTSWVTGDALSGGSFTIRLQHQPDIKTATTGANDGDTDIDLTFVMNIQ